MKKIYFAMTAGTLLANLCGCAVTPDSIVQMPTTARPEKTSDTVQGNGAIFQNAAYRPMFEDHRARMVGDTLTITITESTTASKQGANSGSKSGSTASSVTGLFGLSAAAVGNLGSSSSAANKYAEAGAASSSNAFTGTLGVTVIEVLPNGNLKVSGEKQIGLDRETEYIRISGVISPDTIAAGNIVSSTQVADARVEYRTNSHIDKSEMTGMLARFFLSIVPL